MSAQEAGEAEVAEQVARLTALSVSPEGNLIARRALARVGLPDDRVRAQDLLQSAVVKVYRRLTTAGPLEEKTDGGSAVAAYLTRTALHLARDQVRSGARREVLRLPDDAAWWDQVTAADAQDDAGDPLDEPRWQLTRSLSSMRDWVAAGALTLVTLAEDPARPIHPAAARPEVDSDRSRNRWAALFYAGRDDCLPGAGGDPPDRRNRRTRAIAKVEGALRDAVTPDADSGPTPGGRP